MIRIVKTRDIAYEDWVEWWDFNALDGYCGVFPDDGEARLPITKCAPVMLVGERIAPVRLQQDSLDTSVSVVEIGQWSQWRGFPWFAVVLMMTLSALDDSRAYNDPRNEFETVDGMPIYYGGDLNDSDCENPCDIDYEAG